MWLQTVSVRVPSFPTLFTPTTWLNPPLITFISGFHSVVPPPPRQEPLRPRFSACIFPCPSRFFSVQSIKPLTPWTSASSDLRAHCPGKAKSPGKIIPPLHVLCRMETLFLGIGGVMITQTGSPATRAGSSTHTLLLCTRALAALSVSRNVSLCPFPGKGLGAVHRLPKGSVALRTTSFTGKDRLLNNYNLYLYI